MPIKGPGRRASDEQQTACWQRKVCACRGLCSQDASGLALLGASGCGDLITPPVQARRHPYHLLLAAGPGQGQAGRGGEGPSWLMGTHLHEPVFSSKSPGWRVPVMSYFLIWMLITQV